ncbi:MAG: protein phosphatase 2C domain-containing protein [Pseudomonadota bacterium]
MTASTDVTVEATSALSLGARRRQEDALATSFSQGSDIGFAVLSDGMGGHNAGDIASRVIVTEIFAELTLRLAREDFRTNRTPEILRSATSIANACLKAHIQANPECGGMGGTVLVTVVTGGWLYWVSVGDSPLYLFRDGRLSQLNADHSLAPQIDHMVRQGLIDSATALNHPQRNCLTSALTGDEIAEIDCPDQPFALRPDDIVIAASDGLQFVSEDSIQAILTQVHREPASCVADALMSGVAALDDPEQDNVSLVVLNIEDRTERAAAAGRYGTAKGGAFRALKSALPLFADSRR